MGGTDADAASEERFNDRLPLERARDRAQALVGGLGCTINVVKSPEAAVGLVTNRLRPLKGLGLSTRAGPSRGCVGPGWDNRRVNQYVNDAC